MAKSNVPESVMDTLRRLAEMRVDRGCTPAEAATAAAHLERLLEKWQLSKFDVEAKTYDEEVSEEKVEMNNWGVSAWIIALARACSRPHDCRFFYSGYQRKVWLTFVGHSSDAAVARYLFDTLARVLRDMGKRDAKAAGYRGRDVEKFLRQYLLAAADEVYSRLQYERDLARQQQVESRALVVVKDGVVNQYIKEKYPNLRTDKKDRSANYRDMVACVMGAEAGRSVEIRKGVEGKSEVAGALTGKIP